MNSFVMCITITYSLAGYLLKVQLKTFKHSIVDMAVLGHMKYLFFVVKIKLMYIFLNTKTFRDFSLKQFCFRIFFYSFNKFILLIIFYIKNFSKTRTTVFLFVFFSFTMAALGHHTGLRQFLATEICLKMMRNVFISPQKLFSFSRYSKFCLEFSVQQKNCLIRKIDKF